MTIEFEPCKKGFNMNSSIGYICGVANAWGVEKLCPDCERKLNALMNKTNNHESKMKSKKLFVYGTLKKGFRLNHYLAPATFLGKEVIEGFELYSNRSYPMLIKGQGTVKGEVYEVPIDLFEVLDMIESEYTRTPIETKGFGDVEVYIYKYDVKDLIKLNDGEFKNGYNL